MSSILLDSCLLCGSIRLSALRDYEDHALVKCVDCNFVFCNRKPSMSELYAHYELYLRGNSVSPITIKRYNDLCGKFDRYRSTNHMLDVGCGDGHFLAEAKRNGWNVFGTEFTDRAMEVCRSKGIHMVKGSLQTVHFDPSYFDVITSFEVIEHINNPREEAALMAKLLRPGGLLYVTTPNFNSLSRNLMGPRWNVIGYPEHLCYYTPRSLKMLFQSVGFKMLDLTTTGISIDRINRSGIASRLGTVKDVDEQLREKIDRNRMYQLLKYFINHSLNLFGKGDGLKAFFLKQL